MLKENSIVVILADYPFGGDRMPYVHGNVGIITEDPSESGWYVVKDTKGNEFAYSRDELTPAPASKIEEALREMIRR